MKTNVIFCTLAKVFDFAFSSQNYSDIAIALKGNKQFNGGEPTPLPASAYFRLATLQTTDFVVFSSEPAELKKLLRSSNYGRLESLGNGLSPDLEEQLLDRYVVRSLLFGFCWKELSKILLNFLNNKDFVS